MGTELLLEDKPKDLFLLNRQKALLKALPYCSNDGRINRLELVKIMFLVKMESQIEKVMKFYSFLPYDYGPFSYTLYSDLTYFEQNGLIKRAMEKGKDRSIVTDKGLRLINRIKVDPFVESEAQKIKNRFPDEKSLLNYVYETYPEYTPKSKLMKNKIIPKRSMGICTIGYEGEDIDSFLFKLIHNEIGLVVDVRYTPFSMKFQFNKMPLQEKLQKSEIKYLHLKELGIPGEERRNLSDKSSYDALFKKYRELILPTKTQYVDKIVELSKQNRITLLCFEKDVNFCHRGVIASEIRLKGIEVNDL
jgi:uncharacterized protein (DUF488 family)